MKLSYTILYVENIVETVEFYEKALGLTRRFIHESGDYAEMETGATTLGFAAHNLAADILKRSYVKAGGSTGLIGAQITLEPDDVKTAFAHALAHGAKALVAPEVKPWNFEVAMVEDCNGHIVEFAKAVDN